LDPSRPWVARAAAVLTAIAVIAWLTLTPDAPLPSSTMAYSTACMSTRDCGPPAGAAGPRYAAPMPAAPLAATIYPVPGSDR